MGNSASTSEGGGEQGSTQLEKKLQSDLSFLQPAFAHLCASQNDTNRKSIACSTLEGSLKLAPLDSIENIFPDSNLPKFISELGPAISRTYFRSTSEQVDWSLLLSGFDKCCKQGLGVVRLKMLLTVFVQGKHEYELLPGLHVGQGEELSGSITMSQLQDLLGLCWLMMCHARLQNVQNEKVLPQKYLLSLSWVELSQEMHVTLPDLRPLLASCYAFGTGASSDTAWNGKEEIVVEKVSSWILATVPGILDSLAQYVQAHLQRLGREEKRGAAAQSSEEKGSDENKGKNHQDLEVSREEGEQPGLLTLGTAWAVGLSQRDLSASKLVQAACDLWGPSNSYPTLLYRSSNHGRGISRFWTRVEGYKGPVLMLISATSIESDDDGGQERAGESWVAGALVPGGFDNKEVFYGTSSCCLFAVAPTFLPLRTTGRETNFVYSHRRTPGSVYRSHPKPEGVGFGGSLGKERLWLDDEFLTVTVQHHALDKTYHSGSIAPKQGYGLVKGRVGAVEVWGLGGSSADEQQAVFQHRENLFSEQRRKVDLKNFGNWQDSPEAMMMDMVSNPNKAAREER